jgi:hypothetical protein
LTGQTIRGQSGVTSPHRSFDDTSSRLQELNHGGSGSCGVFFVRHMAEVAKDGEPAAVDVAVESFGVTWRN